MVQSDSCGERYLEGLALAQLAPGPLAAQLGVKVEEMKHMTLATARLRFLFLAARIWRHAGREGISYSDHYQEKGVFQRLLKRLRAIVLGPENFLPVLATPLSG